MVIEHTHSITETLVTVTNQRRQILWPFLPWVLSPSLRKNCLLKTLIEGVYNGLLGQMWRGTIYLCIVKFYVSVFSSRYLTNSFSGFSFCISFQFIIIFSENLHTVDYDEPGDRRVALFCFPLLFFILPSFVPLTMLCRIVSNHFSSTRWRRLWLQELDFPGLDNLSIFGDEIKNSPCALMQIVSLAVRSLHISLFLYPCFPKPHTSIDTLLPQ